LFQFKSQAGVTNNPARIFSAIYLQGIHHSSLLHIYVYPLLSFIYVQQLRHVTPPCLNAPPGVPGPAV